MKKKILAVILLGCMMLGLVGCGNTSSEDNENSTSTNNIIQESNDKNNSHDDTNKSKYENISSNIRIVKDDEYKEFQGKIDDYYIKGSFEAIYSDGVLYEKDYDDDYKTIWITWEIGDVKDILLFDTFQCVAENTDNSLIAFIQTEKDGTSTKLESVKLNCTREEFRYGTFTSSKFEYHYAYNRNDTLYYEKINIDSNESIEIIEMQAYVDDEIRERFKITDYFTNRGLENYIKDSNNNLYSVPLNSLTWIDWEVRKAPIFEDVESCYGKIDYSLSSCILAFNNDKTNLYIKDGVDSILIPLPNGYTTDNIKEVNNEWDLILQFDNGSFYQIDISDIRNLKDDFTLELTEIESISVEEIKNNIKKWGCDISSIYLLMNDGYLYKINI